MPLASKIAFQFERRLQFKGLNLFHGHAVRVTDANQSHLYGEVMGGNRYPVRLTYQEGLLSVHCACAYFDETGRCKHLWAAVLEADKRGVLGDAQKGGALRVVRDAEAEDLPQNPAVFGRPSVLQQTRTPPWQEYLADIRQSLETRKLKTGAWPKDFEIVYVIDVAASRTAGAIVLELHSRSRKKSGEWTVLKDFRIAPAQVSTVSGGRRSARRRPGGQELACIPTGRHPAGLRARRFRIRWRTG